jgi:putative transposase
MASKISLPLRNKEIWLPKQVCATDIAYIKLSGGLVYLAAITVLLSREVLSWRVSNTHDAELCAAAMEEAVALFGIPAIFNTDQGCQFTSEAFTGQLEKYGIKISMDGVNRALDDVFVERFWRS